MNGETALPQTNLQLYRLLIDRGAEAAALETVRVAHDTALRLFGCSVRPSQKPFIAHLVGTAGALIQWGKGVDLVAAGLLHSAYLYGDFRDGRCGAHPVRRRQLGALIGHNAESMVYAYTLTDWRRPLAELMGMATEQGEFRDLVAIKLADTCDELADCGPRFCPEKPLDFGATIGEPAPESLLALARQAVSDAAADQLAREFDRILAFTPPSCLTSADRAFHTIDHRAGLSVPLTLADRGAALCRRLARLVRHRWRHALG